MRHRWRDLWTLHREYPELLPRWYVPAVLREWGLPERHSLRKRRSCVCNSTSCPNRLLRHGHGTVHRAADEQQLRQQRRDLRHLPGGQNCVNGSCVCNAASCPTGCCNAQGQCITPPTNNTCGVQGELCVNCPAGTVCVNGDCVCYTPRAARTCCSRHGHRRPCITPPTDSNCGSNGAICVTCPAGDTNCVRRAAASATRRVCPTAAAATRQGQCITPPTNNNCGVQGGIVR